MGHFDTKADERAKLSPKDKARWLNAGAQVGEFVNRVARRSDLIAKVGAGLGHGAPACYIPTIAEIEVDATVCLAGVDPSEVAIADPKFQLARSPFIGAITHEAAHAKYSTWVPASLHKAYPDATQRVLDVFVVLEESRIEAQIVLYDPSHKKFLNACAGEIVARDFRIADDVYGASVGAALLLARVSAGVFTAAEVEGFRDLITGILSEDTLATLESLWTEFQTLSFAPHVGDTGTERGLAIAREWLAALDIPEEDSAPNFSVVLSMPGSEGEGEGEGESGSEGEGEGGLGKALADAAREHSMDADRENMKEKRALASKELREAIRDEAARRKAAKSAAETAFSGEPGIPGHGLGGGSHSRMIESRLPTPAERSAAVRLARELERAQYADRASTKVSAVLPPGRLRSRGAVQRAAEESRGAILTAKVWEGTRKAHTDEPPVTVGILTDISGSMGMASEPSASLSWIMAEATRRVHGKVATVLFGTAIHGVVRAGARQDRVNVYSASDGHEAFKPAFEALDGELDLLNAPGARVLVIFSDAHLVKDIHEQYAYKAMEWCKQRGVAVVWIDPNGPYSFKHNHGFGEVIDSFGVTPLDAALSIGKVVVEAIRKANLRRQAS